jgi:hypothetical protein
VGLLQAMKLIHRQQTNQQQQARKSPLAPKNTADDAAHKYRPAKGSLPKFTHISTILRRKITKLF